MALQDQTLGNVSGGNSVPSIDIFSPSDVLTIGIINRGKYPIYNLTVKIKVFAEYLEINPNKGRNIKNDPKYYFEQQFSKDKIDRRDSIWRSTLFIDTVVKTNVLSTIVRLAYEFKMPKKSTYISYDIKTDWLNGMYFLGVKTNCDKQKNFRVVDAYIYQAYPTNFNKNEILYVNFRKIKLVDKTGMTVFR